MNGPVRLKNDAAWKRETGCDLADEVELAGPRDLSRLRERVLAGPATPLPRRLRWLAAGGVAGAVLLHAGWLAMGAAGDDAPTVEAIAPPAAPSAPVAPPEALPERAPPEVTAPKPPAGTPPNPPAPPEAPAVVAPAPSLLAEEIASYDAAADALADGRSAEAADAFRRYLASWPAGRLRDEASLGLLDALVDSGDTARAEALAAELADRPSLAAKRTELLAVRAEALVGLGRCEEALLLARALPRPRSAPIRRVCRGE